MVKDSYTNELTANDTEYLIGSPHIEKAQTCADGRISNIDANIR